MGETLRTNPEIDPGITTTELEPRQGSVIPVSESFGISAIELGLAETPTETEQLERFPDGMPEIAAVPGQPEAERWMLVKFFPNLLGIVNLGEWNKTVTQPVQANRGTN